MYLDEIWEQVKWYFVELRFKLSEFKPRIKSKSHMRTSV